MKSNPVQRPVGTALNKSEIYDYRQMRAQFSVLFLTLRAWDYYTVYGNVRTKVRRNKEVVLREGGFELGLS